VAQKDLVDIWNANSKSRTASGIQSMADAQHRAAGAAEASARAAGIQAEAVAQEKRVQSLIAMSQFEKDTNLRSAKNEISGFHTGINELPRSLANLTAGQLDQLASKRRYLKQNTPRLVKDLGYEGDVNQTQQISSMLADIERAYADLDRVRGFTEVLGCYDLSDNLRAARTEHLLIESNQRDLQQKITSLEDSLEEAVVSWGAKLSEIQNETEFTTLMENDKSVEKVELEKNKLSTLMAVTLSLNIFILASAYFTNFEYKFVIFVLFNSLLAYFWNKKSNLIDSINNEFKRKKEDFQKLCSYRKDDIATVNDLKNSKIKVEKSYLLLKNKIDEIEIETSYKTGEIRALLPILAGDA
jgi:hypothetical protein